MMIEKKKNCCVDGQVKITPTRQTRHGPALCARADWIMSSSCACINSACRVVAHQFLRRELDAQQAWQQGHALLRLIIATDCGAAACTCRQHPHTSRPWCWSTTPLGKLTGVFVALQLGQTRPRMHNPRPRCA